MAQEINDVTVTITADTATPTIQGFGVPMFAVYHNHYADRAREYTSLSGMTSDGFTPFEPGYLMAQSAFSQNPRPAKIVIGRLSTATARTFTLTVLSAVQGDVVKVTLTGKDGIAHVISYTIGASATTTTVAAALAPLITTALGTLGAAAAATAVVTVTPAAAGDSVYATALTNLAYADTGAVANYATNLSAIQTANDNWYAVAIEHQDAANIQAAAAWVESASPPKVGIFQTADTVEIGTGTSVLGAAVLALLYKKSTFWYSADTLHNLGAGILGQLLPYTPGQANWAFKQIAGVAADDLTPTQRSNLEGLKMNHYTIEAGVGVTRYGTTPSGQYIDISIGIDWTAQRMKEAVFGGLVNAPKIPYTDVGIAAIAGMMLSVLNTGVRNNLFAETPAPTVTPPAVVSIATTDKQTRVLNNISFAARFAGAVNKVNISGTLSV